MRLFLLILIASVFINSMIHANENDSIRPYQIGIRTGGGFIIKHNPRMSFITNQHIGKRELYFQKSSLGKSDWQQRYGFPRMGLSLTHFSLNNPEHLGDAYSIAPYLNFNVLSKRVFRLRFRTALGFGFIEKPFDIESNHKNAAIGSKLNLFFSFSLEGEIDLLEDLGLSFGSSFSHFSNTLVQRPNLGINIPTIEAGIFYRLGKKRSIKIIQEKEFIKSKARTFISGGMGISQTVKSNDRRFIASALLIGREKQLNHKSSIGANIDLFYNDGRRKAALLRSITIAKGFENLQVGLSMYHSLNIGRLNVIANMGYYLKSKDRGLGKIYHLAGGRIRLSQSWGGFIALKTHFARAEYLLFGLSYQLGHES